MANYMWENTSEAGEAKYTCRYCDAKVAPSKAYYAPPIGAHDFGQIFICPNCTQPTFFSIYGDQTPSPLLGRDITGILQQDILSLYDEARACTSVGAYTGSVMICRKILMNLAVQEGAVEGENFVHYVNYLFDNGYVPPKGKGWVDAIRKRGNTANHEIRLMNTKDAELMLHFVEGLLRFNYELPNMLEEDSQEQ